MRLIAMLGRVEAKSLERGPSNPSQIKDEQFVDGKSFLAVVDGSYTEPYITPIGHKFLRMADSSPEDAWRWLLIRAMWIWWVPNGSASGVNVPARDLGVRFNFLDMITRLVVHLRALPAPHNILFFDELLPVLNADENWTLSSEELHDAVLAERAQHPKNSVEDHDRLLGVLENRFDIPRDNFSKMFTRAFPQTGLFTPVGNPVVGLRLDPAAFERPVFARRLEFILDNLSTVPE